MSVTDICQYKHKQYHAKMSEMAIKQPEQHRNLTPEQAFALEKMHLQGEEANKLLIQRSRALLYTVIVSALSAMYGAYQLVPLLLKNHADIGSLIIASGMLIQLITVAYFLRAKDAVAATQVLRLLIILYGLRLFLGLAILPLQPQLIVILVLMAVAYKRIEQFKYN